MKSERLRTLKAELDAETDVLKNSITRDPGRACSHRGLPVRFECDGVCIRKKNFESFTDFFGYEEEMR